MVTIIKKCEECFYHDPFNGEETQWAEILEQNPDSVLCGFGFTDEEQLIKEYGHLVKKTQCCPKFKWPGYCDDLSRKVSDILG